MLFFGLVYSKFAEDNIEDIYPCARFQEGMITFSLQTHDAYMAQRVRERPEDARYVATMTDCAPDSGRQISIRNDIWRPSSFF